MLQPNYQGTSDRELTIGKPVNYIINEWNELTA